MSAAWPNYFSRRGTVKVRAKDLDIVRKSAKKVGFAVFLATLLLQFLLRLAGASP